MLCVSCNTMYLKEEDYDPQKYKFSLNQNQNQSKTESKTPVQSQTQSQVAQTSQTQTQTQSLNKKESSPTNQQTISFSDMEDFSFDESHDEKLNFLDQLNSNKQENQKDVITIQFDIFQKKNKKKIQHILIGRRS